MQPPQQKLQDLLQQLFRADDADLDFGIYRIINYRRDQIQNFIDEELPAIINEPLTQTGKQSLHIKKWGTLHNKLAKFSVTMF